MSEHVVKVFFSYSRKDQNMLNALQKHLAHLRNTGKIATWHDLDLEAGIETEPEILERLNSADIILLLISSDFIASEYCYGIQLKQAIARHDAGAARVIPIILRACDWNNPYVPFSKLHALPTQAEPITCWADQDKAFTDVAQHIRKAVEQIEKAIVVSNDPPVPTPPVKLFPKSLQDCEPTKLLFIKNVKDPSGWAYSLSCMQEPNLRVFELMWRIGSHGANTPRIGSLMILHQRAKVTHVVEFLDDQARETATGYFRRVRAVWFPEQSWEKLAHQKEILGFSPNYADGNTHYLGSPNFVTFRKVWSNVEEFQKHIFKVLA